MEAGAVIAMGTPAEVRADPLVIASYLGTDDRAIQRSNA
jgi:ABC-type branched-subunit amino acid transport system ATPase component